MKKWLITPLLIAFVAPVAWAQERIYRCGNEYTNNAQQAKERGCKLVEGGNVTVVQGSRSAAAPVATAPTGARPVTPGAPSTTPRPPSADPSRDNDTRAILESELRKAETRHAELLKEYNNGEPERHALDIRNPQRYMERTAELKANVARSESDIASIKREIGRLPAPAVNN